MPNEPSWTDDVPIGGTGIHGIECRCLISEPYPCPFHGYDNRGFAWRVEVRKLNLWQAIVFWFQRKFGRYKKHRLTITDKDGNVISPRSLDSTITSH